MMRNPRTRWGLAMTLATLSTFSTLDGFAQQSTAVPAPVSPAEMLEFFGYSPEEVKKLENGEILSVGLPELEGSGKGLAVGFAMRIPHGVDDCSEQFSGPEMFRVDPNVLAFGAIDPGAVEESLKSAAFSEDEAEEARNFLRTGPGSDFNLSLTEIRRLESRAATAATAAASPVQAASEALREMLATRVEAYLQKGLAGIEAYARTSRKTSSAADDLKVALAHSPIVENRLPAFHRHLLHYPEQAVEGGRESFYWVKRRVDGRPIFSLVHWSLLVHPEFAFLSERDFYVSHAFNAQQVFFGVFPYEAGVIVFYLNRTFTDQVDIFAKSVAHRIGRKRLEAPLRDVLERMREQVVGH